MVNSQQKGAAGEREFIKEVERLIPGLTLFRNTYQQRVESHHSDVLGVPGFAVEVKRYGKTTTDWYQSAWCLATGTTAARGVRSFLGILGTRTTLLCATWRWCANGSIKH